ncbi:C3a anaphylatoxin chemotactic receptor [Conger conger]|uniref:C3a anaphylatoxin chemotactic receptor n=1 Tax=Conger conger TaxID=82655 RepID=UPI002A59CE9E|nr:C3a anaphylatoxin chemotactic receptor [Conger conger]XP_061119739.1 C3a anaphylatoxin chemotactic receptor [Conger conger]
MAEESTNNYEEYDYLFNNLNGSDPNNATHSMTSVSLVFYSLTCLLGLPGNAFVIWIAGFKMKRTVNTVWFLNLASADFLCCLSIPFSIVELVLEYHWPYGNLLCKVIPTIIILNMFASVFTLTLISLDRFALVIKPVWAQNHRKLSWAYLLCGAAWIAALLLSIPSMIYRELDFSEFTDKTRCMYGSLMTESFVKKIYISRFVFGFVIPLFIIVACYSLIGRKVSSIARSQKAMKLILGVIVAFFVCWLPYHVVGLILEYGGDLDHAVMESLDPLSISLAYMNSCLNPILYVFMGQDFKEKVRLSLRRILENAFDEDVTKSTSCSREQPSRATHLSEVQL